MNQTLNIILKFAIVLIFSPLLIGIIAKTKALFAGRKGIPLFQIYYDILKLFRKGSVYSTTSTWLFKGAPIIFFSITISSSLLIPIGSNSAQFSFIGDMIVFAYILGVAKFFMVIAALSTGSSFEGMGASREMTFSCLAEIVLFLDFIVLGLLSGKFMLSEIVSNDIVSSWKISGPALLLISISYFIVLLSENSRIPIDDPETHLELTMIHEVMILDNSGWDLGYILYGSSVKLFTFCSLFVMILLPRTNISVSLQNIFFIAGIILTAVLIGTVESIMARLRLNRIPQLLISSFVIALIALLVTLIKLG